MLIQFKHFHDSLNTVVTLAPGCKVFFVKCVQFLLTFIEWNRIHFWDKPYQKIIFKSHLNSVLFVNKEKYCQICTCPVWLYFTLLVCANFSKETDKCQS